MVAVACPRCGRPTPTNLADPSSLKCAACGFFGATPPEIVGQLHTAHTLLFRLDVRLRQLSAAQRRAVANAANYRAAFIIISAILAVLLSFWAIVGVASVLSPDDPTDDRGVSGILLAVLPLCLFAALSGIAYRYIQGKHRALENACAARPPREKGEPAGCHVCGAPLSTASAHSIARCVFCAADNLVDPQVLARLGGQQAGAADAIEREITREARAAAGATGVTGALMLPAAIAMPFVVIFWLIVVTVLLSFIHLAPSMKVRYVAVSTPAGHCVARLRHKGGKAFLDFGADAPEPLSREEPPPEGASLDTFDVTALQGRTVRMRSGKTGHVVKSYQTPGRSMDNDIKIEAIEGGGSERRLVSGTCFAETTPAAGSAAPL